MQAETLFQALADPTRLRSITLLMQHGELCVCELTHALELSQPKISRHLAHLREAGLVSDRRQGLWVYYTINPALPKWAREVIETTAKAIANTPPFYSDAESLKAMPNRPGAQCSA